MLLGSVAGCTRPSGGPTDSGKGAPASGASGGPAPSASASPVEPCRPLTAERAAFWARVVPSGGRVDLGQPMCGTREPWEWYRCGDRGFFRFAQPSAPALEMVYGLDGALVGVHGRFMPEPAPEVCEGEKPVGPCVVFTCGRAPPGAAGARNRP